MSSELEDVPTTTTPLEEEVGFFIEMQSENSIASGLRSQAVQLRKTADILDDRANMLEAFAQKFTSALNSK